MLEISIESEKFPLLLAAEEEKIYHLLAFFLQTQKQLCEEYEGMCILIDIIYISRDAKMWHHLEHVWHFVYDI